MRENADQHNSEYGYFLRSIMGAEFFHFLRYVINTNLWKLKRSPIGNITDSNDASVFIIFENCFQYRMWKFFCKVIGLFTLWDLQIFNCVWEKGIQFRVSSFLRLCFVRKKGAE